MRSWLSSLLVTILTLTSLLISVPATAAVGPPTLTSVTLNPTSVTGGASSTVTVTLTGPAPSGGLTVKLSSSNTGVATVPASVTVPSGATTTTFTISTNPVATNPNVVPPGVSVVISASRASADPITRRVEQVIKTATLRVLPPFVKGFLVGPPVSYAGGYEFTSSVELTGPAPSGGVVVHLASNNTAVVTVPASLTVPARATWAAFTATTRPVTTPTSVTISAYRSAFDAKTVMLTVKPPVLAGVTLPRTAIAAGNPSTGTVSLFGRVASGAVVDVTLSSSNQAVAPVQANVRIGEGKDTATFPVPTNPVPSSTSVTISAFYAGVTKTVTLRVYPPGLASFTCYPTSVQGGTPLACTVGVVGQVSSGPTTVHLSSSDRNVATVPEAVAAQPTGNFLVTTKRVTASTPVTIFASSGEVTKTVTLTVMP